ncbi:MAG: energy-coupling factor ABC transporter ATP-binding protein [Thermofilum sp.]|jgi:energy-coupling factor transport system ATP-binding protein|nr:energy-coupling factor ABC transporter ATP-binding protein [Thermofilum sp.]
MLHEGNVVVQVRDLYYTYPGGIEALKGVNLEVYQGEVLAIMGENGAGKTTLVKHFNGILKPTRGQVLVKGIDTRHASVAELSRIVGFVFQNPDHQLFADTVYEEVAFALRNFGYPEHVIESRVKWALNLMDLWKYRTRSPFSLSVGERKRLTIASVLAYDPEIIVLDEPTAGQDHLQKEKISEIIHLLRLMGKTVVIVTHDVEFVTEHVDRVAVMARGKILAVGPPQRVLCDPRLLREARLVAPQLIRLSLILRRHGILNEGEYEWRADKLAPKLIKVLRSGADGGSPGI